MKTNVTYGYCRVSTAKQSIIRQIDNIKRQYPDAIIMTESYTGTTLDRPEWNKLYSKVVSGDTIVFDEVSRMSRNAAEGFRVYNDLYNRGVNLVFLKESMLNTAVYRKSEEIAKTGNKIADVFIDAINKVLMIMAEEQIKAAFETAQHEVDFLHRRTSEGVRRAMLDGKRVGRKSDSIVETQKAKQAYQIIKKHSKAFGGSLDDTDVIKLAGVSRNSYYKYKKILRAEL